MSSFADEILHGTFRPVLRKPASVLGERQRREEAEREARKRKEEAERRERERLAAIEKAKIDALHQDAEAWRVSATIRAYVAAARDAMNDDVDAHQLEGWSRWALEEADRLDPIASGRVLKCIRAMSTISTSDQSAAEAGLTFS